MYTGNPNIHIFSACEKDRNKIGLDVHASKMKASREQVKHLLIDTVTLLCKNSLQFDDDLCIEGLLGVRVDSKDVFFVHISETFDKAKQLQLSETQSEEQTHGTPTKKKRRNDHGTISSDASTHHLQAPVDQSADDSALHRVKQEGLKEASHDRCLIVDTPSMKVENVAHAASIVAGQRRANTNRHSHRTSPGNSASTSPTSYTDTLSENNSAFPSHYEQTGSQVSLSGNHTHSGPWPNLVSVDELAAQAAQASYQSGDAASLAGSEIVQPGCSAWPVSVSSVMVPPSAETESGPSQQLPSPTVPSSEPSEHHFTLPKYRWTMMGHRGREKEKEEEPPGSQQTKTTLPAVQTQSPSTGRNHECSLCGKIFSHDSSLKRHLRGHAGERPYRCEVCDAAFIQSSDLKKHFRSHTGEKPYSCVICGMAFSQMGDRNRHQARHARQTT